MVKTSEMSMELKQELAFTKEELAELEAAKKMPITFDADCPETTPERAVKFRRVLIHRWDTKTSFTTHFFGKIQYIGIK